jgi:hypothetical protein
MYKECSIGEKRQRFNLKHFTKTKPLSSLYSGNNGACEANTHALGGI